VRHLPHGGLQPSKELHHPARLPANLAKSGAGGKISWDIDRLGCTVLVTFK